MTDTKAVALVARGGTPSAIIPRTIEEAFRLATAFAKGKMLPKGMDTPEAALAAIIAGAEVGLPPFQAISSIAVINGRPTLWGDGLLAIARNNGVMVAERIEGSIQDGDAVAVCEVTRPDTGEVVVRTFSIEEARRASLWGKAGPWAQYPQRMLQMRARAFALRDAAPDLLRGLHVREEVEDMGVVQSATVSPAEAFAVEAEAEPVEIEIVEEAAPETVEVQASDALEPDDGQAEALPDVALTADLADADLETVLGWAQTFDMAISQATRVAELNRAWKIAAEAGRLPRLAKLAPDRFRELQLKAREIEDACNRAQPAA